MSSFSAHLIPGSLPPHVPVLLLGNKVDLPNAVREEEIYFALGLDELQARLPEIGPFDRG